MLIKMNNKRLFYLISGYFIISFPFKLYGLNLFINYLNAIFWLIILTFLISTKGNYFIHQTKEPLIKLFIIIFVFDIIYFSLGYLSGFIRNPMNHQITNLLGNILTTIIPIIGIECVRYILIKSNFKNISLLCFLTITFILNDLNINYLINLSSLKMFYYFFVMFVQIIFRNILFTLLSLKYNYYLPIVISVTEKLVFLSCFILPNMNWFMIGSFYLIKYGFIYYSFLTNPPKQSHYKTLYFIIYLFIIIFICFMLGLFKYEAIAIMSNSMQPTFSRGDIVIYKKDLKDIKKESIIVYKIDQTYIIHRVINKEVNSYETKGDNNLKADIIKVKKENVKGIYCFHIKYLGYPVIWLNELLKGET